MLRHVQPRRQRTRRVGVTPQDLDAYKPHFDVLFDAFGAKRIVWGSNWPIVEMGGTIAKQIALAAEYLEPMGQETRDNVMSNNALSFYSRKS